MCDCHSNAGAFEGGKTPPAARAAPSWSTKRFIAVDACIADVIYMLWANGIVTGGCCCGHNREAPSVILETGLTAADCQKAKRLLRENDGRAWNVMQWQLVTL